MARPGFRPRRRLLAGILWLGSDAIGRLGLGHQAERTPATARRGRPGPGGRRTGTGHPSKDRVGRRGLYAATVTRSTRVRTWARGGFAIRASGCYVGSARGSPPLYPSEADARRRVCVAGWSCRLTGRAHPSDFSAASAMPSGSPLYGNSKPGPRESPPQGGIRREDRRKVCRALPAGDCVRGRLAPAALAPTGSRTPAESTPPPRSSRYFESSTAIKHGVKQQGAGDRRDRRRHPRPPGRPDRSASRRPASDPRLRKPR